MLKEKEATDWKLTFKINRAIGPYRYINEVDENKIRVKFILNKLTTNLELKNTLIKIQNNTKKIEKIKMKSENKVNNIKEKAKNKINNIKEETENKINNIKEESENKVNNIKEETENKINNIKEDFEEIHEQILTKINLLKENIIIYKKKLKLVEMLLK